MTLFRQRRAEDLEETYNAPCQGFEEHHRQITGFKDAVESEEARLQRREDIKGLLKWSTKAVYRVFEKLGQGFIGLLYRISENNKDNGSRKRYVRHGGDYNQRPMFERREPPKFF